MRGNHLKRHMKRHERENEDNIVTKGLHDGKTEDNVATKADQKSYTTENFMRLENEVLADWKEFNRRIELGREMNKI